jgi:NADH-quinone oxidoreductase subunit J
MEMAIFLIFAALALVSAVVVVAHKNPVYSTLSLVLTLFAVAVLFVLLGAPFLGALQILVYAGAIVVLFLFVIMLLNVQREEHQPSGQIVQRVVATAAAVAFFLMLGGLFRHAGASAPTLAPLSENLVGLRPLARALFTEYLLPFEIVGLLLLVAVIGATVVAKRPTAEEIAAESAGFLPGEEAEP